MTFGTSKCLHLQDVNIAQCLHKVSNGNSNGNDNGNDNREFKQIATAGADTAAGSKFPQK